MAIIDKIRGLPDDAQLVVLWAGEGLRYFDPIRVADLKALAESHERMRAVLEIFADHGEILWEDPIASHSGLGRYSVTGSGHPREIARKALGGE